MQSNVGWHTWKDLIVPKQAANYQQTASQAADAHGCHPQSVKLLLLIEGFSLFFWFL